jgi:ribonuclease-3
MDHPRDPVLLEERIGYRFASPGHLRRALIRLAYAREQEIADDETMDAYATLGDAVIDVVVLEALVRGGGHDKGVITNRKTDLVNMSSLRRLAEALELQEFVRWGKGERAQHVWTSGRVLAECMEALVGAVYLDGGMRAAAAVLDTLGFPEA